MRSLTRAVRLAPLFAALLLGGCVTAETVSVDTTATAVPVATRGPDEPRDDLTLGKEHFRARHYGLAEMHPPGGREPQGRRRGLARARRLL